jgi:hypothetical protein
VSASLPPKECYAKTEKGILSSPLRYDDMHFSWGLCSAIAQCSVPFRFAPFHSTQRRRKKEEKEKGEVKVSLQSRKILKKTIFRIPSSLLADARTRKKTYIIVCIHSIIFIIRFFTKGKIIMLNRIGFVDKNKVWSFVKAHEYLLKAERWNRKQNSSGRKCLWFGLGVDLGFKSTVFEGFQIDNGLRKRCNDLWCGSDWNSILLYKYQAGCELKSHVDRDIFDSKVIVVNISEDSLLGGNVEFLYNGNIEILSNGEIIEFNSKIPHGIKKLKSERWSLSIRKIITA